MNKATFLAVGLSLSLASLALSQRAEACGWPTKSFACCEYSPSFPNMAETRFLSGCATSTADAHLRCRANAGPGTQYNMRYNTTSCQGATTPPPATVRRGKICTVARRTSDSFTYFAWDTSPNATFDQVCESARRSAREGSPGRAITHFWKSNFNVTGTNEVTADCMEGERTSTGLGINAVHEANRVRKNQGRNGCYFKVTPR